MLRRGRPPDDCKRLGGTTIAHGLTNTEVPMPERHALEQARRDRRERKRPTTQAGEFVREEIHHIRSGKHGARSTKQATPSA
jgi:hypothetical protein